MSHRLDDSTTWPVISGCPPLALAATGPAGRLAAHRRRVPPAIIKIINAVISINRISLEGRTREKEVVGCRRSRGGVRSGWLVGGRAVLRRAAPVAQAAPPRCLTRIAINVQRAQRRPAPPARPPNNFGGLFGSSGLELSWERRNLDGRWLRRGGRHAHSSYVFYVYMNERLQYLDKGGKKQGGGRLPHIHSA